jgi:protoporphyrinogen oxidase
VKRELSQNVLNYVAGPLISTLFFYGSDETSAWLYLVLAKHMYNVRMSALRGGLDRMVQKLSEELDVVAECAVKLVEPSGDGYVLNGERFSDVVIAVPGDTVLKIQGVDGLLLDDDRRFFRDCAYQPITSVRVATERPVDGRCYAVTIPRVEKMSASTISFHDYIDPGSISDGAGRLTISGGGASVSSSQLLDELHRLYQATEERTEVLEWKPGMPKFPPGRYQEIARFHERSRRPGLFFCGDYLLGPLVEGAVATGLRAADAIRP